MMSAGVGNRSAGNYLTSKYNIYIFFIFKMYLKMEYL